MRFTRSRRRAHLFLSILVFASLANPSAVALPASLLPSDLVSQLLAEASGERVLAITAELAALARYPASQGFARAAEIVAERARAVGLAGVRILSFPADVPSWDVRRGELWVLDPEPVKLADAAELPLSVAQYSRDAEVEAEIVAVGGGTNAADYRGVDVRGKIVLASGPPHQVEPLAIVERGAVGIISYAQSAFFGIAASEEAVAWGYLSPERAKQGTPGFAFMLSPTRGRALAQRLAQGERLRARVRLRVDMRWPGQMKMVVAEIPGTRVRDQDIVFTAHLDHPPPGANDNASGSAALLEIARVLLTLIRQGKIPPPLRTMRFWWVTEIESTYRYFFANPEEASRLLVNVNIDQAGGDRHGRTDFIAIRQPSWMGTFADDIIRAIARLASDLAPVGRAPSPLFVAPTGTRDPFALQFWPYAPLSDHLVFETSGIGVPSISLAAPSLRYIHTSEDRVEHLDPTALKRMVFLGAACGLFLANATARDLPKLLAEVRAGGAERLGEAEARALQWIAEGTREDVHARFKRAYHIVQQAYERESRILASLAKLALAEGASDPVATLKYESGFTWNLFVLQEAAVQLLTEQYERTCRTLGVAPQELEPEAEERRLHQFIPMRTLSLGPEFRAWLEYTSPRLGLGLSTLVKNLIDGERSLAHIYWAASAEFENVALTDIEVFVNELVAKGWVKLRERQ
ncbi:MAG: M28 family peptidase [Blastocatellia bacterium]|nr:M28 family peptidase [Blastocatellia bacterium]MCS7157853.1 M28 family peptidase [Blastocatellia bacterium]MCX7753410.1 M28 family peptidase [Blastocatellia bacterium]MDW8168069.1 M28 family peptidase [Acidobacteriota bacterium]MDW8257682.1 M28 family peptidase [Acidobacteriota bacterium]